MSAPIHRDMLRQNRLLAALPQEVLGQLHPHLEPVQVVLKQRLYEQNQPITDVYFVQTAVISLVIIMPDKTIVEVAMIGREGMLGLSVCLGARTSSLEAICQVRGNALRIGADAFGQALHHNEALHSLLQHYTQALFCQVAQSIACNRVHSAGARCARWLLMTHDRVPGDEFPLTQESLAQMIGVRRATVTVVAGMLQKAGLITYTRGRMTIHNRQGLEAAACECYRIVSEEFHRLLRAR
jgi:CRP-like cAMP-binding protein